MVFQQEKTLRMLRFGFVSGHDFSRAVNIEKELGFSPCQDVSCTKCLYSSTILARQGKKDQGLKPRSWLDLERPD
jgi:hypothetical protein